MTNQQIVSGKCHQTAGEKAEGHKGCVNSGDLLREYAQTYCWGPRGMELGLVGERGGGGGTSGRRGEWRSRS